MERAAQGEDHTDTQVHLILEETGEQPSLDDAALIKSLGLAGCVGFQNVHLLDARGRIRRFVDPREVVDEHCRFRREIYRRRRAHEIARSTREADLAADRARYIRLCLDGTFDMRPP